MRLLSTAVRIVKKEDVRLIESRFENRIARTRNPRKRRNERARPATATLRLYHTGQQLPHINLSVAMAWQLLLLLSWSAAGAPAAAAAAAAPLALDANINYASFLGRADPVWRWSAKATEPPPAGWWSMGFTGNGMLAWMVTAGANSSVAGADLGTLRLEIGRTDVVDDRVPGSRGWGTGGSFTRCMRERIGIGYFELQLEGKVTSGVMRLVLHDAEIVGALETTKGVVNYTIATHALKDINYANVLTSGGEKAAWRWVPHSGSSPWSKVAGAAKDACGESYVPNPPQVHGSVRPGADSASGPAYTTSPLLSRASFSTAYATRIEKDGSSTLLSSTSRPMTNANTLSAGNMSTRAASASWAAANVRVGTALGFRALRTSHKSWWHRFYEPSFLTLSDSRMEAFYWAQIYKLGSATRADKAGPTYGVYDHTGPWFLPTATCCPLFNWDSTTSFASCSFLLVHAAADNMAPRLVNFPVEYVESINSMQALR